MTQSNKRHIGKRGELLASNYLRWRWFRIIETNYTVPGGEIDLIAKRFGAWHFVEVKYRKSTHFGNPEDAMTPAKLASLHYAVDRYCAEHDIDPETIHIDFLGIFEDPSGHLEYRFEGDIGGDF